MKFEKQIAAKIEEARDYRGISYAELGRRSDIDPKRLRRVLNGERAMHVEEFITLCIVLNLSMTRFVSKDFIEKYRRQSSLSIKDFGFETSICEPSSIN